MMRKILFLTLTLLAIQVMGAVAQTSGATLGNMPKKVNYRDARIRDVGMMASDVYQWVTEDPQTHKVDTVVTTEQYILWQKDGDLEQQAEARRAKAPRKGMRRAISTEERTGALVAGATCNFHYQVFVYDYPSVDADGNQVMLSAICACPPKKDCKEVRDVVIGTHITITKNDECPSHTTKGFDAQDWGVMMSMAGGPKLRLGSLPKMIMAIAGIVITGGYTVSLDLKEGEPSNNYNLVIMADYEGYGISADRAHPYLYQELTARQVVDATRYGIALYNQDPATADFRHPLRQDFRTISCGYSQGGSVALATHRFIEQNDLTEELHFAGSICGDGPYDPIATVMFYIQKDLNGDLMSMPVVLPLIVKGMLDTNPYMKAHKVSDFFQEKFIATGVMDWLTEKNLSTDEIGIKFAQLYDEGKDGDTDYFKDLFTKVKTTVTIDGEEKKMEVGRAMLHDIMTPECYNYFKTLYLQYSGTYNTSGIPVPNRRGVYEDLHLALASNDLTEGWKPQHAIFLFHSTADNVVPYANAERAKTNLGDWAVLHTSTLGHDHVEAGTDFFQSDNYTELAKKLDLRTFIAKRKLCDLPWNGQTTSTIPNNW